MINSPQGTISDYFVAMTFLLEIDGGMKFCLLLRLKSQNAKGASLHTVHMVTHVLALSTYQLPDY